MGYKSMNKYYKYLHSYLLHETLMWMKPEVVLDLHYYILGPNLIENICFHPSIDLATLLTIHFCYHPIPSINNYQSNRKTSSPAWLVNPFNTFLFYLQTLFLSFQSYQLWFLSSYIHLSFSLIIMTFITFKIKIINLSHKKRNPLLNCQSWMKTLICPQSLLDLLHITSCTSCLLSSLRL